MLFDLPRALLSLSAFAGIASSFATEVPNGIYHQTFENGIISYQPIDDPTAAPIQVVATEPQLSSAKFQKRRTDCWVDQLDHREVDDAINDLRYHTRVQGAVPAQCSGPTWVAIRGNTSVYVCCVGRYNSVVYADSNSVEEAVRGMDAKCPAYQASWYGWDRFQLIIGKASVWTPVCTGPF